MFDAVYHSPWVSTALLAAITIAGFAVWLRRRQTFLVAYIGLFTIEILGDALRSGTWSPLHLLHSRWENIVGLGFVLAGDFRYFLLVERWAQRPDAKARDATPPLAWLTAFAFTMVTAVITYTLMRVSPEPFAEMRWSYLTWEALFLLLVVPLRVFVLPRRLAATSPAVRTWLLDITHFEIAQYSLWLLADVVLLTTGLDAAFLLRVVPNIMYYGLFLWFVAFRAPEEVVR